MSTQTSKSKKSLQKTTTQEILQETTTQEILQEITQEIVEEVSFTERMDSLIHSHKVQVESLKCQIREMEQLKKTHNMLIKSAGKKVKKVVDPNTPYMFKKLSGFTAPASISTDLSTFLVKSKAMMKDFDYVPQTKQEQENWPCILYTANSQIARTDVVKHLHNYIKQHNLKIENSNKFNPDTMLKKILSDQESYATSMFHACMNTHFVKKVKKEL